MGSAPFALDAWIYLADAYATARRVRRVRSHASMTPSGLLGLDASSPLRAPIARVRATAFVQNGDLSRAGDELLTALGIERGGRDSPTRRRKSW